MFTKKLSGTVEVDESVIGGVYPQAKGTKNANKTPVVALVQRGGPVRSQVMPTVNGKNLKQAIRDNVLICSEIHTDSSNCYEGIEPKYTHKTVNHSLDEFTRREGENIISTTSVESYFSLLKRGVVGTFHHLSP